MIKVVFICSGNICRSPMAQYAWTAAARQAGVPTLAVSMGTLGLEGRSASRDTIEVMRQVGIDVSGHRSQAISFGILERADRIYVMALEHERHLLARRPDLAGRIRLLGRVDDPARPDIEDPIGQPVDVYLGVRDRILRCIAAELPPG